MSIPFIFLAWQNTFETKAVNLQRIMKSILKSEIIFSTIFWFLHVIVMEFLQKINQIAHTFYGDFACLFVILVICIHFWIWYLIFFNKYFYLWIMTWYLSLFFKKKTASLGF